LEDKAVEIHLARGAAMIEKLEPAIAGVVCLHCGMHTPLPESTGRARSANVFTASASHTKISLIRCAECGKEAPYLADEIVILERISNIASYAA
jgi:hypothetical protein